MNTRSAWRLLALGMCCFWLSGGNAVWAQDMEGGLEPESPTLLCIAYVSGDSIGSQSMELATSPEDPTVLEGHLANFEFFVDLWFLDERAVAIQISDVEGGARAYALTGLVKMEGTTSSTASLTLTAPKPDGAVRRAQVDCVYEEPAAPPALEGRIS